MPVNLVFTTYPEFLQSQFGAVREVLVGLEEVVVPTVVEKTPEKVVIAAASRVKRVHSPLSSLRTSSFIATVLKIFRTVSIFLATILFLVFVVPVVYFRVFPADVVPVSASEEASVLGGEYRDGAKTSAAQVWQPPVDKSLPDGTWLSIPKIGVRTQPKRTENSEDALRDGVWWVPEFGGIGDRDKPTIFAAHRYGYQWWWKGEYWKYNSFNLLPELKPGDIVEVISEHRKWTYEIYAGEEGEEISDYNADLILYTCKFLNSPIRHFRYARLVKTD